jgi:hypothetical protein
MRLATQFDPIRGHVHVYVETLPGHWLTATNEHVSVDPGEEPPRYLDLPMQIAELLKVELDGGREPATNRHLDDAIAVRDRLLAMVERSSGESP